VPRNEAMKIRPRTLPGKYNFRMRIDHVAHPSRNPFETHRFYADVMGFELVQAYAGTDLLLVYAVPGGGSLAFSVSRDHTPRQQGDVPWERRHVGLTVPTRAEYESWLNRLKESSVPHRVVDDERIYFADPDGLVLELEVESAAAADPNAFQTLARWSANPGASPDQ
jgi:catechol 2,3-dioxygenase-like lactoylglutathione lyase family enzyme